jgi:plastocyanin
MKKIGVALALVATLAGTVAIGAVLAAPNAPRATATVTVTALDFRFKLSKSSVPTGTTVTFNVTNKGNTAHDFDFSSLKSAGTKYLQKGQKASFKVTFKKKGSYRYVCTVPRHAELGMQGKFNVT